MQVETKRNKRYNQKLYRLKNLLHAYIFICFVGASTTLLIALYSFYNFVCHTHRILHCSMIEFLVSKYEKSYTAQHLFDRAKDSGNIRSSLIAFFLIATKYEKL